MSADNLQKVRDLFEQAADLPAAERAAFLEALRARNPGLYAEVASLLALDASLSGTEGAPEFLSSPVLRTPADPVTDFDAELRRLVKDLTDTMVDAPGLGLAAPQLGVGLRVLRVRLPGSEPACSQPRSPYRTVQLHSLQRICTARPRSRAASRR